jgi:hypothetical protein
MEGTKDEEIGERGGGKGLNYRILPLCQRMVYAPHPVNL